MRTLKHRWRPWLSAVALALVVGVLLTPVGIAHIDLAPDVCDLPSTEHAGGERVASARSFELHDHCYTCHWLQSFRSTLLSTGVSVLDVDDACVVLADADIRLQSVDRHSLPARAPPASALPTHA